MQGCPTLSQPATKVSPHAPTLPRQQPERLCNAVRLGASHGPHAPLGCPCRAQGPSQQQQPLAALSHSPWGPGAGQQPICTLLRPAPAEVCSISWLLAPWASGVLTLH